MTNYNYALLFFLKNGKKEERTVYCRITVDGIPREFSTKKKWPIKRWSQKNRTVTDNRQDAKSFRAYLGFIAQKVLLCWIKLNSEGVEITSEKLIESITGRSKEKKMTLEFYICEKGSI